MAWFEDELPAEWPTKSRETSPKEFPESLDFSTSQSESGDTIAVRSGGNSNPPPWQQLVPNYDSHKLTQMFMPPPQLTQQGNANSTSDENSHFFDKQTSNSGTSQSTSTTQSSTSDRSDRGDLQNKFNVPNRKLQVFGNLDTFTNEKFGELIDNVGQENAGQESVSVDSQSDSDLASQLKNKGRDVLRGLHPPVELPAIQESSLDQLEQQLTSQDRQQPSGVPNQHSNENPSTVGSTATLNSIRPKNSPRFNSTELDKSLSDINDDITELRVKELASTSDSGDSLGTRIENSVDAPKQETGGSAESHESRKQTQPDHDSHSVRTNARTLDPSANSTEYPTEHFTEHTKVYDGHDGHKHPTSTPDYETSSALFNRAFEVSPLSIKPARSNHKNILKTDRLGPLSGGVGPDQTSLQNMTFSVSNEQLAHLIRQRYPNVNFEEISTLDLSNCGLETLADLETFCPNLTTLFLNNNNLTSLQGLPKSVVHLDLSNNKLGNTNKFPVCFISTLILANNELQSLEPLVNLRALSSLDVSQNKLTSLTGCNMLTALRHLNLRDNLLGELDLSLGMLSELDVAFNNLTSLRLDTPNLETLDVESNKLVRVYADWPNLRNLNVRFNEAVIDLVNCESLESVLMDGNLGIRNLERAASNLITFSWELQSSPFVSQYGHVDPRHLLAARDIKLSGRVGWPLKLRGPIYAVQHLDLANCQLKTLPSNLDTALPFLKSLNLSFNNLSDSCISTLCKTKLERLSVYGNKISLNGISKLMSISTLRVLDTRPSDYVFKNGEYPTDKYALLTETSDTPVKTNHKHLQWFNGRPTTNPANLHATTRPGFPSGLYSQDLDMNPNLDITQNSSSISNKNHNGDLTAFDLGIPEIIETILYQILM